MQAATQELHDVRSYAQVLQNKLTVVELKYEDLVSNQNGNA